MASDRIIVFDLDGTLVDSMRDLVPALNRTIAHDGLSPIASGDISHFVGKGAMAMIGRAFEHYGKPLSKDRQKELLGIFLEEYEAHIADHTIYFDGAMKALDTLGAEGWRFAICTNKFEHLARKLMEQIGGAQRFAAITGGDTFEVKKPDPAHIVKTVELAGGDPKKAVMVGDTNNDIDAAIAAHIPSIAVTFGYSDRPVQELGASAMINHFDQLSDAVRTLSSD